MRTVQTTRTTSTAAISNVSPKSVTLTLTKNAVWMIMEIVLVYSTKFIHNVVMESVFILIETANVRQMITVKEISFAVQIQGNVQPRMSVTVQQTHVILLIAHRTINVALLMECAILLLNLVLVLMQLEMSIAAHRKIQ